MVIRRWCLARWTDGISDGDRLVRSMRVLRESWLDRYDDWQVGRYGESFVPRWLRPWSRIEAWLQDWRIALAQRKPITRDEWNSLGSHVRGER